MKEPVDELAVLVVDGALHERLADALHDAAMELALDQQRVHHRAEIVDHRVFDDLDVRRSRGRPRPRRCGSRSGRPRARPRGRGRRRACRARRRAAARSRAAARARSMMPIARSVPAMRKAPVPRIRCRRGAASSTCEAASLPFSITLWPASTMAAPLAMIDFEPPVPPPACRRSLSPCTRRIASNGTPSVCDQHLGEGRPVALAVVERAGDDGDGAVVLEPDVAGLAGSAAR